MYITFINLEYVNVLETQLSLLTYECLNLLNKSNINVLCGTNFYIVHNINILN